MIPAFLYQHPIEQAEFSVRTSNALRADGRFPTLGHLAAATDKQLLDSPQLGRRSLAEIREVIKNLMDGPLSGDDLIVTWALSHKKLVEALIAEEARIVVRTNHNGEFRLGDSSKVHDPSKEFPIDRYQDGKVKHYGQVMVYCNEGLRDQILAFLNGQKP
ncbi:MAG: hypothetical protein DI604_28130 [Delftia acidovorans]|nr:MAG: hypothetical protein DI604_28130 [Delftia acidovorans]